MSETRMVSIDGSTTCSGMALFVDGKLKDYGAIDLSSDRSDTDTRLITMCAKIIQALNIWKPSIVYIEQPQGYGKNVRVVRLLSEIIGAVKAWGIINGAYVEEVEPSVWRKALGIDQGGKKRSDLKQMSIMAVLDVFGINVVEDVADAINIGAAMLNKYTGEQ